MNKQQRILIGMAIFLVIALAVFAILLDVVTKTNGAGQAQRDTFQTSDAAIVLTLTAHR